MSHNPLQGLYPLTSGLLPLPVPFTPGYQVEPPEEARMLSREESCLQTVPNSHLQAINEGQSRPGSVCSATLWSSTAQLPPENFPRPPHILNPAQSGLDRQSCCFGKSKSSDRNVLGLYLNTFVTTFISFLSLLLFCPLQIQSSNTQFPSHHVPPMICWALSVSQTRGLSL